MTQGNALPLAVKRLLAEGYGVEDNIGNTDVIYANARVKWRAEKRNARN